jgi:beta-N-acetylhexosaminidase
MPATDVAVSAALIGAALADVVIVGTINAAWDSGQAALVRELERRGKEPIVIALRTPYDCVAFPMIQTYLCTYGIRPASIEAVTRVLFGEIEARGVLPCALPDGFARG